MCDVNALKAATAFMLGASREDALAGAFAYLMLAGDVAGAMLLARGLARDGQPKPMMESQKALLAYYAETVLAAAPGRIGAIMVGADAYSDVALG